MNETTTLDEIVARARHAQHAIRSLELARIEAHDPAELRKLDGVLVVLERLAATIDSPRDAAAAHAAAPAAPTETIPSQTDSTATAQGDTVSSQRPGFSQRLGRVFVPGRDDPFVKIAELPHRDGLPTFEKCVAPDDSPINGAHGIFVTSATVFSAVLPQPFASNGWQVLNVVHCDDPKSIIETVMNLLRRPDNGTLR